MGLVGMSWVWKTNRGVRIMSCLTDTPFAGIIKELDFKCKSLEEYYKELERMGECDRLPKNISMNQILDAYKNTL